MQRLLSVGAARLARADCLEAAAGYGGRRWTEGRLYEVLRSSAPRPDLRCATDRFPIAWTDGTDPERASREPTRSGHWVAIDAVFHGLLVPV